MLNVIIGSLAAAAGIAGVLYIVRAGRNRIADQPSELASRIRTPTPPDDEIRAALAEGKEWEYECVDDIVRIAHERTSVLLGKAPEPLSRQVEASVFLQFALGLSRYICALNQDVGGRYGIGAVARSRSKLLAALATKARKLAPDAYSGGMLEGPAHWERELKHWDQGHALPGELQGSVYDGLVREIASKIGEQLPIASAVDASSYSEMEMRKALDQLNASSWIWELGEG